MLKTEPPKPIDREDLLARLGWDEDLLEEIVALFLEDSTRQTAVLGEDVRIPDAAAAERHAHTLRGAAANIGAGEIGKTSADIERAAREGDMARARDLFAKLEAELEDLKRWVIDGDFRRRDNS